MVMSVNQASWLQQFTFSLVMKLSTCITALQLNFICEAGRKTNLGYQATWGALHVNPTAKACHGL